MFSAHRVWPSLLLAAWPAFVWAEPPAPLVTTDSVGLILDFRSEVSESVVARMRREFETVFRGLKLGVEWRVLNEETPSEVFGRIVMVRLNGGCTAEPSLLPPSNAALGYTHISNGVVLPFVEISCDRVRALVADAGRSCAQREQLVGRALGRVLAHGVYHVLTGTTEHAQRGVARRALTVLELTCEELRLSRTCLGAIRQAVTRNRW